MLKKIFLIFILPFFLFACGGEIKQTSLIKTVGTKVGNEIIATRGDAVIKIINKESMPNAFGKADIFGRTRDTGTTSLIFIGGNSNEANFIRRDVDIKSNKTTMNSSPTIIPNNSNSTFSGFVGGESFSGSVNTYNAPIFLPPNTPKDTITNIREIKIRVSVKGENNTITIDGNTIKVLDASENELRYRVIK